METSTDRSRGVWISVSDALHVVAAVQNMASLATVDATVANSYGIDEPVKVCVRGVTVTMRVESVLMSSGRVPYVVLVEIVENGWSPNRKAKVVVCSVSVLRAESVDGFLHVASGSYQELIGYDATVARLRSSLTALRDHIRRHK